MTPNTSDTPKEQLALPDEVGAGTVRSHARRRTRCTALMLFDGRNVQRITANKSSGWPSRQRWARRVVFRFYQTMISDDKFG